MQGLTSLDLIIINEPTKRFILSIIANDEKAFSASFMLEILKRQEILQPGKAPNLAKSLSIYQQLLNSKMVEVSNPMKTKVTWRGNFFRFYTHPSITFWGIIAGVAISIWIGTCTNNASTKELNPLTQPEKIKSIYDSLPYHQKKDTFFSETPTK